MILLMSPASVGTVKTEPAASQPFPQSIEGRSLPVLPLCREL